MSAPRAAGDPWLDLLAPAPATGLVPLRRAGSIHPSALLDRADRPLDEALVDDGLPVEVDPELAAAGRPHLESVLAAAPRTWNGPILGFRRFRDGVVRAGRSDYFTMLATSDALAAEAAREGPAGRHPLRERAIAAAGGDPWRDGTGRGSVVGVTLVVRLRHRGRGWLLMGRRQPYLAVSASLLALVDGCAEAGDGPRPLLANVERELAEEAPRVAALLEPGELAARVRLLGVAMNLLRLSPAFCLELEVELGAPPRPDGLLGGEEFAEALLVPATREGLARIWTRERRLLAPAAAGALALWEERHGLA